MSKYPKTFPCTQPQRGLTVYLEKDGWLEYVEIVSLTPGEEQQAIRIDYPELEPLIIALKQAKAAIDQSVCVEQEKARAAAEARRPVSIEEANRGFAALREQMGRGRE